MACLLVQIIDYSEQSTSTDFDYSEMLDNQPSGEMVFGDVSAESCDWFWREEKMFSPVLVSGVGNMQRKEAAGRAARVYIA